MAWRQTRGTQQHHEVDVNGQVIRLCGSKHIGGPLYMALAGNSQLIVSDQRKARVVILKEDLQPKRILLDSLHGQPLRLCFSMRTGLLFTAFYQTDYLTVHRILRRPH